ncbi:twin-arginine translocation signal domain-containing protein [Rhodocyclaceae bacterium SMB388]
MKQRDDEGRESRRKFLKSVALTGGGVAVAATVGQAGAAEVEAAPALEAQALEGYHETQHIRDYYARAQF